MGAGADGLGAAATEARPMSIPAADLVPRRPLAPRRAVGAAPAATPVMPAAAATANRNDGGAESGQLVDLDQRSPRVTQATADFGRIGARGGDGSP
jgi:hypothetical protein